MYLSDFKETWEFLKRQFPKVEDVEESDHSAALAYSVGLNVKGVKKAFSYRNVLLVCLQGDEWNIYSFNLKTKTFSLVQEKVIGNDGSYGENHGIIKTVDEVSGLEIDPSSGYPFASEWELDGKYPPLREPVRKGRSPRRCSQCGKPVAA